MSPRQSIYPPMLSQGLPRRHHIITYLLLLSTESHEQLEVRTWTRALAVCPWGGNSSPECCLGVQARMCPSESEVSAYAWLEPPVLEAIAATEDGAESLRNGPSVLPATVG